MAKKLLKTDYIDLGDDYSMYIFVSFDEEVGHFCCQRIKENLVDGSEEVYGSTYHDEKAKKVWDTATRWMMVHGIDRLEFNTHHNQKFMDSLNS